MQKHWVFAMFLCAGVVSVTRRGEGNDQDRSRCGRGGKVRANTSRKGACGQVGFLLKKLSSFCAPKRTRGSREKARGVKLHGFYRRLCASVFNSTSVSECLDRPKNEVVSSAVWTSFASLVCPTVACRQCQANIQMLSGQSGSTASRLRSEKSRLVGIA